MHFEKKYSLPEIGQNLNYLYLSTQLGTAAAAPSRGLGGAAPTKPLPFPSNLLLSLQIHQNPILLQFKIFPSFSLPPPNSPTKSPEWLATASKRKLNFEVFFEKMG